MEAQEPDGFDDLLVAAAKVARGDAEVWGRIVEGLPGPVQRRIFEQWSWQAHGGQREPEGDWRVWLLMAGRGFGKTLAGSQWVWARVRENPRARVALVGATIAEVERVMVLGPSGILATAGVEDAVGWAPAQGLLRFGNEAVAFAYSGANPEGLRGPEHHFAWCDELAKWRRADDAWDNLQMGMRLGERPRLVVTTTPRPCQLLQRVKGLAGTVETGGRTDENVHIAAEFRRWAAETYGGTRLGRQELDGVLFEDVAGALWTRQTLERARFEGALPAWKRVVVGVDPPASADGDACGIVVCALGADGICYVLADCSVAGERPEGWARAVVRAAEAWGADRVVAEKNNGGDMVESVLRHVEAALPVRAVSAAKGKSARAEPVAALFEAGKARLAGRFPALEDELAGLTAGGDYVGPGNSPDRADAMVWALTALAQPRAEPNVRFL